VARLTGGLESLAKQRKVTVIRGRGRFVSGHELQVEHDGAARPVSFAQCVIAAGSESARLPGLPDDPRISQDVLVPLAETAGARPGRVVRYQVARQLVVKVADLHGAAW
jgi:pyruvate/2-oxoglutarate dehydrogenase complex dihydrolipoamide dehydrogenase (E3) component